MEKTKSRGWDTCEWEEMQGNTETLKAAASNAPLDYNTLTQTDEQTNFLADTGKGNRKRSRTVRENMRSRWEDEDGTSLFCVW